MHQRLQHKAPSDQADCSADCAAVCMLRQRHQHPGLTIVPPPKAPEAEGSRDRGRMLCWLSSSAVWEAAVKGEAAEPVRTRSETRRYGSVWGDCSRLGQAAADTGKAESRTAAVLVQSSGSEPVVGLSNLLAWHECFRELKRGRGGHGIELSLCAGAADLWHSSAVSPPHGPTCPDTRLRALAVRSAGREH